MSKVIIILLAVLAVQASATRVQRCIDGAYDDVSVTISGCEASPCKAKKGTTLQVGVKFSTTSIIANLGIHLTAKLPKTDEPLIEIDTSVANSLYDTENKPVSFPLQPGQYVYIRNVEILEAYPEVSASVRLYIESIACFKADIMVVD